MATRTPPPEVASLRGRLGGLSNTLAPDDPDLIDAKRDLAAAKLAAYVKRVVSAAPRLTEAQADRIAALLRTAGGEA